MFRNHGFFENVDYLAPSIKIELANEANAKEIADIGKKTHQETYPNYNAADREELLERRFGKKFIEQIYLDELISKKVKYFKATYDNKIIGFSKLILHANNIAELDKLYVLKDYQGQKIGSKLLQMCFDYALRVDVKAVTLSVSDANLQAIAFYKHNGFSITGDSIIPDIPNSQGKAYKNEIMICTDFAARCQSHHSPSLKSKL